jgi:copper chaperone CopZ
MTTKQYLVEGMSCEGCARSVEAALEGVAGVASAVVNLEAGRVTVERDETLPFVELQEAVSAAGYVLKEG